MKKTIIAITLFSFAFLSLHVHIHENDQLDHASDYNTVEEDCDFCQFNSENSFVEISTTSAKINFKNITFKQYVSNYMSFNIFCFLNKSPPQ
ncbi:MAG: hypothetical protein CM15mP33_06230 [Candidatus Neomarinimicrobiota bacterium]|nr:MAG: hypothetical protein CM15mP33_06230 [Candidatus Neomarinimicrobiota bacterium]